MEPEAPEVVLPPKPNFVFYNDRGLRAGWRLLIYCGMIYILIFAVRLIAKHAGVRGEQVSSQTPGFLLAIAQAVGDLIPFLVLLLLAWIMSKIEHCKVGAYGLPLQKSLFRSFGIGCLLWGFLPLALVLLILRALHVFYFGDFSKLNAQILVWGLLWGIVFLLVGLFEEFAFRGYFQHTLADGIGFWPAAIIQAILFARVHMGNGGETKIGIIATALFALFAAATLWRTGNLWLAVGAHAGWDWGQSFFFGVNDSGFQAPGHLLNPSVQGPDWLSGGSVGPEGSIVTLILWALMTLLFMVLYRKHPEPALVITAAPKY
ncbi:MAG TPA: type II CAAX endopeptidase family protein [Candidatus Angelobacter sp.]|nr:type II CAAX endopeptidase family protein [Candidatus Angelobacter sp.]